MKNTDMALTCSHIDLVQIVSYGDGVVMGARTMTTSDNQGAKFKTVRSSSSSST